MLIDAGSGVSANLAEIEAAAAAAEAAGYDGFNVPETRHDAFVSLALAARETNRIGLTSSIAVAFARNPMSMAVLANDIQLISGGRFRLGLGSQVRPHIERRFAMPWSQPAARMEEYIAAIRAIWHSWATGERLAFRGTFYQHTLMTDFFNPVAVFNQGRPGHRPGSSANTSRRPGASGRFRAVGAVGPPQIPLDCAGRDSLNQTGSFHSPNGQRFSTSSARVPRAARKSPARSLASRAQRS